MDLRSLALDALRLTDPTAKVVAVHALWQRRHDLPLRPDLHLHEPEGLPGRPALPRLVEVRQVPTRSPFTLEGRSALLHAIAHIEFNAINLALDAVWRFAGLPESFYLDWLQVAEEEAHHFEMLATHLATLGRRYGDFEAHDGLWLMAQRTRHDLVARMALVPRTLEARGLDATPQIQHKLERAGDPAAVRILDVILREEIGHVAIGNRWYFWACEQAGLDPQQLYPQLLERYEAPRPRPPFNLDARRSAGFSAEELSYLQSPGWH